MPVVYNELRRLAQRYMRNERPNHTLQPTALVHEAYLRLVGQRAVSWQGRAHFFGVAAQLMRRVLVDHARAQHAEKRGGNESRVELDEALAPSKEKTVELLALDEALNRLAKRDPRQARIVEMRFFGGLSEEETARVLDVSTRTVKRDWTVARAWLYNQVAAGRHRSGEPIGPERNP